MFWGKNFNDEKNQSLDRDHAAVLRNVPQRFMECVYWSIVQSSSVQETTLHSCPEYEVI